MPQPLDLRQFAAALPAQNLSPSNLKTSVCNNITAAVGALAKASPSIKYAIDPAVLDRVMGNYLEAHPNHNNPFNLIAMASDNACRVDYYEMCYEIEPAQQGKFEFIPQLGQRDLVDGKVTWSDGLVQEGKFQYVEQLKGVSFVDGKVTWSDGLVQEGKWQYIEQRKTMCLVDGKVNHSNGAIEEGKWQYVEQLKGLRLVGEGGTRTAPNGDIYSGTFAYVAGMEEDTQLVNGTLTYSNGRSETGEFAYIRQLGSMKLVNGTTKNAAGDVVKHGRREYVPQKNGMMLIEGLSVFPDGKRQEGTRRYIPELNEVVLVDGTITHGNTVQTGIWTYSHYEGRMVFAPKPPKPKLPQHLRNQIQSVVHELVGIQQRFDSAGRYNASAAMLNAAAEQAALAQNPAQYADALQSFKAQYKTLTRELSLLTHPDKIKNYSARVHGAALQQLTSLRESIDGQINRWSSARVNWHPGN